MNDRQPDPIVRNAAPAAALPVPPSVEALLASIDAIIGAPAASALDRTLPIRPAPGPIARLGLALEPWPGLAAWAERERLDALFLHRHWSLDTSLLPSHIAVVASHDGFDRRFGFGDNPELHAALGMHPLANLAERGGFPLGTVAQADARSVEGLREELAAIFGGLDEEIVRETRGIISRVAIARAMTVELVQQAVALGAQAYVTGQLRRPALPAAAEAGMHLFAVGHRRSERWALGMLAAKLVHHWPGLFVIVAPDSRATPETAEPDASP